MCNVSLLPEELWALQFGDVDEAKDFAGRTIRRADYNRRDSEFGWNIDHVKPVSRGGKSVLANLCCCHIKTNDEKADSFPTFWANEMHFNVRRLPSGKYVPVEYGKKSSEMMSSPVGTGEREYVASIFIQLNGVNDSDLSDAFTTTLSHFATYTTTVPDFTFAHRDGATEMRLSIGNVSKTEQTQRIADCCKALFAAFRARKRDGHIGEFLVYAGVTAQDEPETEKALSESFAFPPEEEALIFNTTMYINTDLDRELKTLKEGPFYRVG